ncbi:hypothetical protein DY000_02005152 [Brassica cretica]|uniref:Uncharacterized protein n=1 Tax=Brassica cretica TaxID=69181 RepID=A0ABQ7C366_BRACR|nr:hypothetical protein DY000_02005152 [Brassica cretica]
MILWSLDREKSCGSPASAFSTPALASLSPVTSFPLKFSAFVVCSGGPLEVGDHCFGYVHRGFPVCALVCLNCSLLLLYRSVSVKAQICENKLPSTHFDVSLARKPSPPPLFHRTASSTPIDNLRRPEHRSRGAPHIIRSLDPVLCRSVSLCPSRIYFTSTAASLMDDSHEISPLGVFSARDTSITPSPFIPPSPEPPPCPLTGTSSFLHRRCSRVIAVILVRRRPSVLARVMGPYRFIIGLASPTLFKGPHLNLKAAVSQPTSMWGGLILLFNPLKDFSGFTVFFTETLHSFQYSSCLKSILSPQLPVDSPGPSKPSLSLLLFIEE